MSKNNKPLPDALIRDLAKEIVRNLQFIPSSTYRLQFNPNFGFADAEKILPYLRKLGVGMLYASPHFKAVSGSQHGYDIVNANEINPELGTQKDYECFLEAVKRNKMGLMLDVVPNHMGISGNQNEFWFDVLENGPSSIYSHFFDIDWEPEKKELKNKILLPILGDHYGRILENKEIQLFLNRDKGEFQIRFWEQHLPVAPKTYTTILEHEIQKLKEEFEPEDHSYLEFLSVMTAFRHLPGRTETDRTKILERHREKEIAKTRFAAIMRNPVIRQYVEKRVKLFNGTKGNARSFDLLDRLLDEQVYRLAYWRVAAEEINYRRFFDVNGLAAIRVEEDSVFQFQHQLIFQLIREGKVQGLRIDHPDGLYDPPTYFKKLQKQCLAEILAQKLLRCSSDAALKTKEKALRLQIDRVLSQKPFLETILFFVVVEKILDRKEFLPDDWSVFGTVGYDFLNHLNGLFVDRDQAKAFEEIYEQFTGRKTNFDLLTYERKKFFALVHMSSEINNLALRLNRISEMNRRYRDFTINTLAVAIRETIACFPVYRTYISPSAHVPSERDQRYIHIAIEKAKSKTPALPHSLYDFLKDVLLLKLGSEVGPEEERSYRDFVLRFQQLTGPIMAKGLEDTAFYIYNRLISLNEVGGDPVHFGYSVHDFHKQNMDRNKKWPASLLSSSTHDTKRSEDVRMRINVLSEIPEEWKSEIAKWSTVNEKHKSHLNENTLAPEKNTEYYIYQTLVGAWENEKLDKKQYETFVTRICASVQKAIREAESFTSWVNPNKVYEQAVENFIRKILLRSKDNHFLKMFLRFQQGIYQCGILNSLSASALKLGSPGVVDLYQGTELWDYSLVDPDNRRPVHFKERIHALQKLEALLGNGKHSAKVMNQLLKTPDNGWIKLFLNYKALNFRRLHTDLFVGGDYIPLEVKGPRERNIVAFLRCQEEKLVLVACVRYFHELIKPKDGFHVPQNLWHGTKILLPKFASSEDALKDVLSAKPIKVTSEGQGKKSLFAKDLFQTASFGFLTNIPL